MSWLDMMQVPQRGQMGSPPDWESIFRRLREREGEVQQAGRINPSSQWAGPSFYDKYGPGASQDALKEAATQIAFGAMTAPAGKGMQGMFGKLPMDEASRMARAKALGYTDDVYHGTGADIKEFNLSHPGRKDVGVDSIAPGIAPGRATGPDQRTRVIVPHQIFILAGIGGEDRVGPGDAKNRLIDIYDATLRDRSVSGHGHRLKAGVGIMVVHNDIRP